MTSRCSSVRKLGSTERTMPSRPLTVIRSSAASGVSRLRWPVASEPGQNPAAYGVDATVSGEHASGCAREVRNSWGPLQPSACNRANSSENENGSAR
jgi:hypothetical protein